jgi:isoquinoline 1-oxidoreductase subunit beta
MTTTTNRRSFIKVSLLAGGGMMLSFNSLLLGKPSGSPIPHPAEAAQLNSYIKIAADGVVTLMSPNPEFGSNVKTSMPMILADELGVDWNKVVVEQADFYPERFQRQRHSTTDADQRSGQNLECR